jgi:L-lactate dehydrogenase (cytochrome)
VLIGRPHLYGLAAAGEPGVRHAIDILAKELRTTMALCGAASLAELDRDLLRAAAPARATVPAQALAPEAGTGGAGAKTTTVRSKSTTTRASRTRNDD